MSIETVAVPTETTRLPAEPAPLTDILAELKKGMAGTPAVDDDQAEKPEEGFEHHERPEL